MNYFVGEKKNTLFGFRFKLINLGMLLNGLSHTGLYTLHLQRQDKTQSPISINSPVAFFLINRFYHPTYQIHEIPIPTPQSNSPTMHPRPQTIHLPPWIDKDYLANADNSSTRIPKHGRRRESTTIYPRSSQQQYAGAGFDSYDGSAPFGSPPNLGFARSRSGVAPLSVGGDGDGDMQGQDVHVNQCGARPPMYSEFEGSGFGYAQGELPPPYSESEHGEFGYRNGGQAYELGVGMRFIASTQGERGECEHSGYSSSSRMDHSWGTRTGGTLSGMFGGFRRIPSPRPRCGVEELGAVSRTC